MVHALRVDLHPGDPTATGTTTATGTGGTASTGMGTTSIAGAADLLCDKNVISSWQVHCKPNCKMVTMAGGTTYPLTLCHVCG